MLDHTTFHSENVLLSRLRDAAGKRQVVVLAGSALTMPVPGLAGVPTTAGIVDMIRAELVGEEDARQALEQALASAANPYQKAFETLNAYRGNSAVNRIIRQAVLEARPPGALRPSDAVLDHMHRDHRTACQDLEADTAGWTLSPGVEALGRLAARHPRFAQTILTTNFDPLIEVAITQAGGHWYRLDMGGDGSLGQAHGNGSRVVHLHGHWSGALTLHTPAELLKPRPQLETSLRRLLDRDCVLLVLAYSGWDDLLTRALAAVLRDVEATPEVLWTFYKDDVARIYQESEKLLRDLCLGSGTSRVTLFRGINVHQFLPRLADALVPTPAAVVNRAADLAAYETQAHDELTPIRSAIPPRDLLDHMGGPGTVVSSPKDTRTHADQEQAIALLNSQIYVQRQEGRKRIYSILEYNFPLSSETMEALADYALNHEWGIEEHCAAIQLARVARLAQRIRAQLAPHWLLATTDPRLSSAISGLFYEDPQGFDMVCDLLEKIPIDRTDELIKHLGDAFMCVREHVTRYSARLEGVQLKRGLNAALRFAEKAELHEFITEIHQAVTGTSLPLRGNL